MSRTNDSQHGSASGRVRLIGGRWRGRHLDVVDVPGLRPTGNRVRETLFNWLQWQVAGSRCLDLYAGSGALGLEAASRGASTVTLVETSRRACEALQANLGRLDAGPSVTLYRGSAAAFLDTSTAMFDMVFMDPPFSETEHWSILPALVPHLHTNARVYLESPSALTLDGWLPADWELLRSKRFGDVSVSLFGVGQDPA